MSKSANQISARNKNINDISFNNHMNLLYFKDIKKGAENTIINIIFTYLKYKMHKEWGILMRVKLRRTCLRRFLNEVENEYNLNFLKPLKRTKKLAVVIVGDN